MVVLAVIWVVSFLLRPPLLNGWVLGFSGYLTGCNVDFTLSRERQITPALWIRAVEMAI